MLRVSTYSAQTRSMAAQMLLAREAIETQRGTVDPSYRTVPHTIAVSGSDEAFRGGCIDPIRPRALLCPFDSPRFGAYDIANDRFVELAVHGKGPSAFSGMTPLDAKRAACAPVNSDRVGFYYFAEDQFVPGPLHGEPAGAFSGVVMSGSGYGVLIPATASRFYLIDPAAGTNGRLLRGPAIPALAAANGGYASGIAYDGDWVLCIPNGASPPVLFNAVSLDIVVLGDPLQQFKGGVLHPSGRSVLAPKEITRFVTFDPKLRAMILDKTSLSSDSNKLWGGALAPNGHGVFAPYSFGNVVYYDFDTGTYTVGLAVAGSGKFAGALALPGSLETLFIPARSATLGLYRHVSTNGTPLPANVVRSRFYNCAF